MRPSCRVVRSLAPTRDFGALSMMLDGHIGACLACQAEIARYGKLRRQLAALSDVVVAAPEPLVAAVVAAITSADSEEETDKGMAHPGRVAAAAGAVVAAAAGAVAVAVWRHSKPVVR